MRDSTGKSIVAAKRKAILPGVSNMSSQHATLLGVVKKSTSAKDKRVGEFCRPLLVYVVCAA